MGDVLMTFSGLNNPDWVVLPHCPAPNHHSLNAARGRYGRPQCICPEGLRKMRMRKEYERERVIARLEEKERHPGISLWPLKPEPLTAVTVADFTGGLCTTAAGKKIADGGMNQEASQRAIDARGAAKAMCERCPLKLRCKEWVTTQEKPAGSWGGVWGGMDPWNRRGKEMIISGDRAVLIDYAGR
jgi:hypothetical protein